MAKRELTDRWESKGVVYIPMGLDWKDDKQVNHILAMSTGGYGSTIVREVYVPLDCDTPAKVEDYCYGNLGRLGKVVACTGIYNHDAFGC